MLEEKIEDVRRTVGLAPKDPPRSSWLAPLAVGVAAIGGVIALVVSRVRGRSQAATASKPASKALAKPKTSTRARSAQSRSTGTSKPTTRRSRATSTAKRSTAKKPASSGTSSD